MRLCSKISADVAPETRLQTLHYYPIFNTPMAKVEYSWGLTAIGFIPVALQYEDFV
jgi:hypothetical protein